MSDLVWLSAAQMSRIEPHFPLSHGMPRVDDRRVISGTISVIKNGMRWRDAPADYGPVQNDRQSVRLMEPAGRVHRIFAALAAKGAKPEQLMIDATYLKAHQAVAFSRTGAASKPATMAVPTPSSRPSQSQPSSSFGCDR